jgi:hypothetical protein
MPGYPKVLKYNPGLNGSAFNVPSWKNLKQLASMGIGHIVGPKPYNPIDYGRHYAF